MRLGVLGCSAPQPRLLSGAVLPRMQLGPRAQHGAVHTTADLGRPPPPPLMTEPEVAPHPPVAVGPLDARALCPVPAGEEAVPPESGLAPGVGDGTELGRVHLPRHAAVDRGPEEVLCHAGAGPGVDNVGGVFGEEQPSARQGGGGELPEAGEKAERVGEEGGLLHL